MRTLRFLLMGIFMFTGSALVAQETDQKMELEKNGPLVKAIFYHENGEVAQEGIFKNGKLHGEWIAYDENGNKTAIGRYAEGQKIGKWFFWNDDVLSEVDFEQSRIASVKQWKNDGDLVSK